MSERFTSGEQQQTPESSSAELETAQEKRLEELRVAAEKANENQKESVDQLEASAEDTAKPAAEIQVEQTDSAPRDGLTVLGTQKELKQQSYERKLQQVRSRLSKPEKTFSKVIHQSAVNTLSETSGKTLFRASGILGGAMAALAGSIVLLYMAKHYGFRYNYLAFFVLFVGGWLLGILIELATKPLRHKS